MDARDVILKRLEKQIGTLEMVLKNFGMSEIHKGNIEAIIRNLEDEIKRL